MSPGRPRSEKDVRGAQIAAAVVALCVVLKWPVLGALGLLVIYAALCAFRPVVDCGRCGGSGKLYGWLSRRAHRTCPRCDGQGVHVRLGRQLVDWANH